MRLQRLPGGAGTPAGPGAMLPRAWAGACSLPRDSRRSQARGPGRLNQCPRGQEGALPSPCTQEDIMTCPCSVS